MAYALIVVGILQIAAAGLAVVAAKSNIHEIYAAILFTGGVLELGLAFVLLKLSAAVKVGHEISNRLSLGR